MDVLILRGSPNLIDIKKTVANVEKLYTLVSDLTETEDEIRKKMTKTVKNEINRAKREQWRLFKNLPFTFTATNLIPSFYILFIGIIIQSFIQICGENVKSKLHISSFKKYVVEEHTLLIGVFEYIPRNPPFLP